MVQSPGDRLKSYWPRSSRSEPLDADATTSKPREWSEWLANCMAERPALTLATAAVVGLAVGWIVKRK